VNCYLLLFLFVLHTQHAVVMLPEVWTKVVSVGCTFSCAVRPFVDVV